jgi:hypothetical protein
MSFIHRSIDCRVVYWLFENSPRHTFPANLRLSYNLLYVSFHLCLDPVLFVYFVTLLITRTSYSQSKVKAKAKLSLCFNWAPRQQGVLGKWRYSSTHSLTSALDGGDWSASRPGRFNSGETAPCTHCIGGWVGPRAVLDAMVKKIPNPRRESNPRTPIVQFVYTFFLRARWPRVESRRGLEFSSPLCPVLRPTQPPIRSPPPSAEVK